MSKKCGNCGNLVRDDASVFCNKCGSQLPVQEFLTCKRCGTTHSDLKSQFCSKCGTPLDIPTPPVLSSHPGQGITCPGCGFVNPDESSSYCKKCGNYLGYEPGVSTQKGRSKDAAIRIKPDPVNIALQRSPNIADGGQQILPVQKKRILQKSRSGSYKKTAIIGSGVIIVIVIIAAIVVLGPNILFAGLDNSTIPKSDVPTILGTVTTATHDSSMNIKESKTQAEGSSEAVNNVIAGPPSIDGTSASKISEIRDTQATVSNSVFDFTQQSLNETPNSTLPWLSDTPNSTPPWLSDTPNSTPPWLSETPNSTPPWLGGIPNSTPPWLMGIK